MARRHTSKPTRAQHPVDHNNSPRGKSQASLNRNGRQKTSKAATRHAAPQTPGSLDRKPHTYIRIAATARQRLKTRPAMIAHPPSLPPVPPTRFEHKSHRSTARENLVADVQRTLRVLAPRKGRGHGERKNKLNGRGLLQGRRRPPRRRRHASQHLVRAAACLQVRDGRVVHPALAILLRLLQEVCAYLCMYASATSVLGGLSFERLSPNRAALSGRGETRTENSWEAVS